jgi:hypothetical protein
VEAGLGGLENGKLLRAASGNFDVLITVDRNLPFQQNITSLQISVFILIGPGVTYADLRPLIPKILKQLMVVQPGKIYHVGA